MAPIDLAHRATQALLRLKLLLIPFALLAIATTLVGARSSPMQSGYGPFGPEGSRMREQLWVLPGADPEHPLRAVVFRPKDEPGITERPLVVINHGTSEETRLAVSMPVYYWMSRWFVERGYVVVLPQRRGHGATAGPLAEAIGDCFEPDHKASGEMAAKDIGSALEFMVAQPFVADGGAIVAGVSSGGWASLALAASNPASVRAIINFAGGRGGHAFGRRNAICGEDRLIAAAAEFGRRARIPSVWFYSENDSYFAPELAKRLSASWTSGGAEAELHVLPAYGYEGHLFPEDRAGWSLWGDTVETFLAKQSGPRTILADSKPAEETDFLNALWRW